VLQDRFHTRARHVPAGNDNAPGIQETRGYQHYEISSANATIPSDFGVTPKPIKTGIFSADTLFGPKGKMAAGPRGSRPLSIYIALPVIPNAELFSPLASGPSGESEPLRKKEKEEEKENEEDTSGQ
jgi:hypothetical protein